MIIIDIEWNLGRQKKRGGPYKACLAHLFPRCICAAVADILSEVICLRARTWSKGKEMPIASA